MADFTASLNPNAFGQAVTLPISARLLTGPLTQLFVQNMLHVQRNLPDASQRDGNLFKDRFDANRRWYTPEYVLAADPDDSFRFDAKRSGDDGQGNPFHTGLLTLGLKKVVPEDVQAFQNANQNVQVDEIKVAGLTATLVTTYRDAQTGELTSKPYPGTVQVGGDGSLKLTFAENILGPSVITLYHNLMNGGASVIISGTYDVWRRRPKILNLSGMNLEWIMVDSASWTNIAVSTQRSRIDPDLGPVVRPPPVIRPPWDNHPGPRPQPTPGPVEDDYVQGTSYLGLTFELGKKYAVYTLKFTITTSEEGSGGTPVTTTRPIISIDDLRSFNVRQSEYKEITELGDIRQRYPSISRLYFGVLSNTIVVIPSSYAIVRTINGASSLCTARLDSASTGISKCKFQFTFMIAPDVNPTEMAQLARDLSTHPVFGKCAIKLPDFLKEGSSPRLATAFQSASGYSGSLERNVFQLTIEIADTGAETPAVADANLLIKQLCLASPPFLSGTISLKLDDYFPDPVEALVVLNFRQTSGRDELTFSVDETAQKIDLQNHSSFDLIMSRLALCTPSGINVLPDNRLISKGSSLSVPLPADYKDLTVLIDRELAVEGEILKSMISQFLTFISKDVQSTQYRLGINASDVEFENRGISKIGVQVTLSDVPDVDVPSFSLNKLQTVEGTVVLVPLEHAISNLQASVLLTVFPIDPQQPQSQWTVQHDFIDEPILILQDADLANAQPS